MLRRCLQLHLSLIVLADQTPRKAWPFRPPPGDGFGLDGDPVSEGLLLMDVSLIVAERGVQIVARHAGKRRSNRLRKGAPWLKTTLVQCAWAAARKKDSYLRAQFQRLRQKRGPK